jgi:hypothetical protein
LGPSASLYLLNAPVVATSAATIATVLPELISS